MDFNTKSRSSKNEKAVMTPGFQVEAEFTGAEVDKDGNIFFSFKNDTGNLRHKEYCIDPNHPDFKEEWAETELERIKHIACALIPEDKVDAIPGDGGFAAWATQLAAAVSAAIGTKVTLHVVVNKKNFASLPLYTNFISSELAKCGWNSNPQYHKYEFSAETPEANSDAGEEDVRDAETSEDSEDDEEF